jgi:DNA-binding Xre family transcriptional regulator
MFNFKLAQVLEENDIKRNALAREAKVRPNLIYEMCDNKTQRIELKTLDKIMNTLNQMTGKVITVADLIEHIPENDQETAGE